jgi:hypothetical protein
MRLRTSLGIAGTLGSILAISWLSVAIACACVPARVGLAWELNLSPKNDSEMTTSNLQAAFNKKYKGQQLLSLPPLTTGRDEECRRVSESRLDCENWLKSGLLWREGLLVSYFTDAKGTVERVEVSDTLGWNVGWITHLSQRRSN